MNAYSLTRRLSLWFALCTAAVLAALGFVLERSVQIHFEQMDRQEIGGKVALVENLLAGANASAGVGSLRAHLDEALVGHPGLVVWLRTVQGDLYAWGAHRVPEQVSERFRRTAAVEDPKPLRQWVRWQAGGEPFRGLIAAIPAAPQATAPVTALVGLNSAHHHHFMGLFHRTLVLSVIGATLLSALLGWAVTRNGLRPLGRLTALAGAVSADQLGTRLPEEGVPGELKGLVASFNGVLSRLEDSFRRLSDFSVDVAHELRTPISNLTLQTQVALGAERDAAEYREVLYSSLEEYDRLGRMIADMLFLAKADHGLMPPRVKPVDLAAEVRALFEYFDAWAEEQRVSLALEGAARVEGDPLMLRRALSNLLTNAVRSTPAGREVRVRLDETREGIEISVENPGPEIPAAALPKLFDRFYQPDSDTREPQEGAGLGLAIVRSIAVAHGGRVAARSQGGLTRFIMLLPPTPLRGRRDAAPGAD